MQCITSNVSEIVSFRITRKLKQRMSRLRHINWSELLRAAVERSVEEEERKLRPERDPVRVEGAVAEMDRLAGLAEGSKKWVGAEEVIRWRKKRYS